MKTAIAWIIIVIVAVGGAYIYFKSQKPEFIDAAAITNEENGLRLYDEKYVSSVSDETILSELDRILKDAAETIGAINPAGAINGALIAAEASMVDFSQSLADFASDNAFLSELNQALGEITK